MIVSGGEQAEIREVFNARGIDKYFDAGVLGSQDDKDIILKRGLEKGNTKAPAVFLGGSYYDYEAANHAGLDFIFIYGWSEFAVGKEYFKEMNIPVASTISN